MQITRTIFRPNVNFLQSILLSHKHRFSTKFTDISRTNVQNSGPIFLHLWRKVQQLKRAF